MTYVRVLKGASLLSGSALASGIMSLGRLMLITRALNMQVLGIFFLVTALAELAASLVLPAFSSAIATYFPRISAHGKKDRGEFIFSTLVMTAACALAFAVAIGTFTGALATGFYNEPAILPFIWLAAAYVLLKPVADSMEAFLLSMERFRAYAGLTMLFSVLELGFSAVAIQTEAGIGGLMVATIAAQAAVLAAAFALLRTHLVPRFRFHREVIRFWIPIGVFTAMKSIQANVPAIFIGKILGLEAVGLFSIARKTAEIIPSLMTPYLNSLNVVALNAYAKSEKLFSHLINTGIKHAALVALYLAGGMALASSQAIAVLYGGAYQASAELLKPLAFAVALLTVNFFFRTVLSAKNRSSDYLVGGTIGMVGNLAFLVLFSSWFGLAGIGYSYVAYAVLVLALSFYYMGQARQKIAIGNLWKPLALALVGWALLGMGATNLPEAVLKVAAFTMAFWGATFLSGFTSIRELVALVDKTRAWGFPKATGGDKTP